MTDGTQRTLARVSCASATQTLAWAAATISGRASESRRAVARLIGKRRSVGSSGAGFSFKSIARDEGGSRDDRRARCSGRRGHRRRQATVGTADRVGCPSDSTAGVDGRRPAAIAASLGPFCLTNRSMAGDTDDGGKAGDGLAETVAGSNDCRPACRR